MDLSNGREDRLMKNLSVADPFSIANEINKKLREWYNVHVSATTERLRLRKFRLNARHHNRKPLISANLSVQKGQANLC